MSYRNFGFLFIIWGTVILSCTQQGAEEYIYDPNSSNTDKEKTDTEKQDNVSSEVPFDDTDTGTDADSDSDTDADADADADSDTDSDADADADSDTDADADADSDTDTDTDTDADADSDADADADSDTDADADVETDTGPEICETLGLSLERIPVRIMLLQDRSSSMTATVEGTPKWNLAETAVGNMVNTWGNDIDFGVDFFSDPNGRQQCTATPSATLDTGPGNIDEIASLMATMGPFTSTGGGRTPLYLALERYLDPLHAQVFLDGTVESYLVVVSDGADSCESEGVPTRNGGSSVTPEQFSSLTSEILETTKIKTIVIGFGDEAEPAQLNAIAGSGGTEFTQFFDAQDGPALEEALNIIGASVHVSCNYEIGTFDPEEVNLDLVNVYFDGTAVPRDDNCAASTGWSWTDETRTAIQFCDLACDMLETGDATEVSIEIMCSITDIVIL